MSRVASSIVGKESDAWVAADDAPFAAASFGHLDTHYLFKWEKFQALLFCMPLGGLAVLLTQQNRCACTHTYTHTHSQHSLIFTIAVTTIAVTTIVMTAHSFPQEGVACTRIHAFLTGGFDHFHRHLTPNLRGVVTFSHGLMPEEVRHEMLTQRALFAQYKKGHTKPAICDACWSSSQEAKTSASYDEPNMNQTTLGVLHHQDCS